MKNAFVKKVRESVKYWYLLLIVGLILIGCGIYTFTSPEQSYTALVFVFSLSFLFSGVLEVVFAIRNKDEIENWGWSMTIAVLTLIVGLLLLAKPNVTKVTLPIFVGFVLMIRSLASGAMALDLKSYGEKSWGTLMLTAVLGLIFSVILIWNPSLGGMTLVFWTGTLFLLSGIFNVLLSLKMRHLHRKWEAVSDSVKAEFGEIKHRINQELS